MTQAKRIGCLFMVWMSGLVSSIQLTHMKYGIPDHYESGWGKFAFAVLLGVMFGAWAIQQNKKV